MSINCVTLCILRHLDLLWKNTHTHRKTLYYCYFYRVSWSSTAAGCAAAVLSWNRSCHASPSVTGAKWGWGKNSVSSVFQEISSYSRSSKLKVRFSVCKTGHAQLEHPNQQTKSQTITPQNRKCSIRTPKSENQVTNNYTPKQEMLN